MPNKNILTQSELMSKGYGLIPKTVMLDNNLSIEAKAIYAFLSSYSGAGNTSFPSVETIRKYLDISRERYYKHRKQLINHGYVVVEKKKNDNKAFQKNIYHLIQEPSKQVELNRKDNKEPCPSFPYTAFPTTDYPYTGFPTTGNSTTNINNNNSNKYNINNNNSNTHNSDVGGEANKGVNNDYSEIISEYNKLAFGLPTQRTYEQIEDWLKRHNKELIIHVMQYAHDLGKHNISYVNGILRNARQRKIETVEDFEAENNRFNSSQNKHGNSYGNTKEAQQAREQAKRKIERDKQNIKTVLDPDEDIPF